MHKNSAKFARFSTILFSSVALLLMISCDDSLDDSLDEELDYVYPGPIGECLGTDSITLPSEVQLVSNPLAGQLYHAAFPGGTTDWGEEDDITLTDVQSYESSAGKSIAWVYFSHNWFRDLIFPSETVNWIRSSGSVPFIRLMLRSSADQNIEERTFTLQNIIDGDFDGDLCAWAQSAAEYGDPLVVEFGTEVNGQWFSWNGIWNGEGSLNGYGDPDMVDGPERFVDAYKHIVGKIRSQGAHNIQWVFHIDSEDIPEDDWNKFENYYPGDEWIDWLGVSVYGAAEPDDDEWPSFREKMDPIYTRLASLNEHMPIVVLEFGVTDGHSFGNQAEWAEAALNDMMDSRWPRVIGFSWWNEGWANDDNPDHDTDMWIQHNPELSAVFQELVGQNDNVLGHVEFETSQISGWKDALR